MTLHVGLSTLQGEPVKKRIIHTGENFAVLVSERQIHWKSILTPTIRHSLRLPGTPTTNTKGNDMATWIWNGLGWSHKDKQIKELRAENVKLQKLCDKVLESEHRLNVQVVRLQEEKDKLIFDNKSNQNVEMEYRESAERFSGQNDDLRRKLDDSLTTICNLHQRMAVLENAIRTAVSIAGL